MRRALIFPGYLFLSANNDHLAEQLSILCRSNQLFELYNNFIKIKQTKKDAEGIFLKCTI